MSPVFAHLPAVPPAAVTPHTAVVQRKNPAPHGWVRYTVRGGDTVRDLAVRYRTSEQAIVHKNRLPGTGGMIRIGQQLWVPRANAPAKAKATRPAPARSAAYRVQPGDTLSGIAAKRGVSLAALLKLNRLNATSTIYAGKTLRVPGSVPRATRPAAIPSRTYTVRSGDTLGGIAAKTRSSLATVLRLNRMSAATVIHPGQKIKVKGSAPAPAKSGASTGRHTVRAGETLSHIAARYHTTSARLVKLNGLRNPNVVVAGQRLRVPGVTKAKATSSNSFAGRVYPQATVSAANRNRAALARMSVPSRSQTRQMIIDTARRHGVDPRLALAIGWQESGWNQRAVSVANAIGAMQVIPSSGEWASQMTGRRLNLLNAQDNVTAGVVILRSLTRSAKNTDQAIAGYYQGLYSVQKNGMYADTKHYVATIKAHRARM
jgi:LysM repeat protein